MRIIYKFNILDISNLVFFKTLRFDKQRFEEITSFT